MKRALPVILSLAVMISALFSSCYYIGTEKVSAFFSVFDFSSNFEEDRNPMSTYCYDSLNNAEKQAYIRIFNTIKTHPEYIKVPKLSTVEFNRVYFAVKNDNPDMLCFSDSCNMITFWSSCMLELHYDHTADECDRMEETLNTEIKKILSTVPQGSDYDKELYIHDYISEKCVYEENDDDSNAYGCLINGKAVCSGYSRALMLLLCKSDIKSILVSGTGVSDKTGNISHMWNIVWLDDEPYQVDMTWDDPNSVNNFVSHMYFNITSKEISEDHLDCSPNIDCTATKYEYFSAEGLQFDNYDKETYNAIKEKLIDNLSSDKNYIEFRFSSSESYSDAEKELLNSSDVNSDIYSLMSEIYKTVGDKIDVSHLSFSKDDSLCYIKIMFDSK